MLEQKGQPPLQTFRDGAVVVKLWRQESPDKGSFVSATVGRTYKDPQTNEYKESRALGGTDMLKAQSLLGEAHKEPVKWRQYFRETEMQNGPPESMQTEAQQESQAADRPSLTLAQQRDAAMANAGPNQSGPDIAQTRDHTPNGGPSR